MRFDPTLNGNGGGGDRQRRRPTAARPPTAGGHTLLVGSDPVTATNATNRDYAVPVHSALDADSGFLEVSNGFAGQASDGLKQLDTAAASPAVTPQAATGNLVQTARVDLGHDGDFELALGLADTRAGAVGAARGSLEGALPRPHPRVRPRLAPLRRQPDRAAAPERRLARPLARAASTSTT